MKSIIGGLLFIVISGVSCLAGSVSHADEYQGYISNIMPVGSLGKVYIALNNGGAVNISCGTGQIYAIDPTTSLGKSYLAVALTAKATGKLVYVSGTGPCIPNGFTGSNSAQELNAIDLKG